MNIEVLVADDHSIYRECLKEIIEVKTQDIKVIQESSNGQDVLAVADRNPVDVYVIDITMPRLNGIETTRRLVEQNPENKIVILSSHNNLSYVKNALWAGARGYVLKEDAASDIIVAIRQVLSGRYFFSSEILEIVVNGFLNGGKNI